MDENIKKTSFILRISESLHLALKQLASARNLSLNKICNELLERGALNGGAVHSPELKVTLDALQDWLGKSLEAVVLFGSRARGDHWSGSDYDLLAVLEGDSSKSSISITRELYRELDRRITSQLVSIHFVYLPEDIDGAKNLFLETALDGRILLDKTGRTTLFLRNLKDRIATGRFRRGMIHGQPVWERVIQ